MPIKKWNWIFTFCLCAVLVLTAGSFQGWAEEPLKGKNVNINTATVEEFMQVPMITEELAEAIVEYREDNGDFQVLEELLQVDGFTREMLRKIRGFLLLEGIGGDECTC